MGLSYVAGIESHTTVWAPGTGPRPPKKWSGHGRPSKLLRRDDKHKPASVKELALACQSVPGARSHGGKLGDKLSSRFARVRVRVAHRDYWLADSRPKEWLLIEWPDGENERSNIGCRRCKTRRNSPIKLALIYSENATGNIPSTGS